ncbi:MAG TPA: parallel beta-helix domain-containing protein [Chakrabartia sp.]|nr:parallel beta-helix domain-containing protein [Chakrabartia sp.]
MQLHRAILTAALASLAAPALSATLSVEAGPDAQERLQGALIEAKTGDTVLIGPGTFVLTDGLSLDVDGVIVKGAGPDRTILSFKGQKSAGEGLLVTSDNVVLRDFAVEDSKGDGIKSKAANQIVYYNLRVEWTNGPKASNGAYGVYPVESKNVLIDSVLVKGASDAGIYVGQSENIIVRKSRAHFNVAGIEIENSYNADVHSNIATRNTAGILVFDLPNLPKKGGHDVRIFSNLIEWNATPNFAPPGNIVASAPTGTGVIVMANKNVHVFGNTIRGHGTTNVMVVGYQMDFTDTGYQPLPIDIVVRGNSHGKAGFDPGPQFAGGKELAAALGSLPPILWDGTGSGVHVSDAVPAFTMGLKDPKARATQANPQPVDLSGVAPAKEPARIVLPAEMEAAIR